MDKNASRRLQHDDGNGSGGGGDDDCLDDGVPLHLKKPFGSGISKRPIKFVPASNPTLSDHGSASEATPAKSAAELYLSIVMKSSKTDGACEAGESSKSSSAAAAVETCEVCKLRIASTDHDRDSSSANAHNGTLTPRQRHEASLAHQVSLAHSHPPSALDRSRMGLAYLQSYGWDPDSRKGLGAESQGIAFPLKPKQREDRLGVGAQDPRAAASKGGGAAAADARRKAKPLDAAKVRKKADEDKKKMERLRQQLYGNIDLEKYLGPGA